MTTIVPIDTYPPKINRYPSNPERKTLIVGSHREFVDDLCVDCGVSKFDAVLDVSKRKCAGKEAA